MSAMWIKSSCHGPQSPLPISTSSRVCCTGGCRTVVRDDRLLAQRMLAGCGALPPSLPPTVQASQSSQASTARQHGCPTACSSALRPLRVRSSSPQHALPSSRQDLLHACCHARPRARCCNAQQTAATLTAEASTASRAPPAAAPSSDAAQHRPRDSAQPEPPRLPQHDPSRQDRLDLVVAGGGPAGLAVAERVSAAGYQVRHCVMLHPQCRA